MKTREPKKMRFDEIADGGKEAYRQEAKAAFVGDVVNSADLLDVGCWTGDFASLAASRARSVTGLDIEPRALEVARGKVPRASFVEGSVLDLPFEEAIFDVVTFFDVLEHLPVDSEARALREISRVTRPGGCLALGTPSKNVRSCIMDPAWLIAGHRHYRLRDVSAMMEEAGFVVTEARVCGGWLVVADYMALYLWKYLAHRPMPGSESYRRSYVRRAAVSGFVSLCVLGRKADR